MISAITSQTAKPGDAAAAASVSATGGPPRPAASSTLTSAVQAVLLLEVPVLTVLRFHLRIYHLARALRGLVAEMQLFDTQACAMSLFINATEPVMTQKLGNGAGAGEQAAPGTTLESVATFFLGPRGTVLAQQALIDDDLIFLHAPAQIALAILRTMQQEAKQFGVAHVGAGTSGGGGAAAAQAALASLDIVDRFLASKAASAPLPPSALPNNSTPAQRAREQAALVEGSQARLASIQARLESARSSAMSLDKKVLKLIEKRRKAVSNPLKDPSSKIYAAAKEEAAQAKMDKRAAKKAKERAENTKKEDDFLMGLAPADKPSAASSGAHNNVASAAAADDDDDDGGFVIKRAKRSHESTPIQATDAAAAAAPATLGSPAVESDISMLPSPRLNRKSSNLAQQFAEAAAADAAGGGGDGAME
jgi:hypothetical protein